MSERRADAYQQAVAVVCWSCHDRIARQERSGVPGTNGKRKAR